MNFLFNKFVLGIRVIWIVLIIIGVILIVLSEVKP